MILSVFRADFRQDNSSARTPRKTPPSFVKNACLQLRCLAVDFLFRAFAWHGPHIKHSFPYIFVNSPIVRETAHISQYVQQKTDISPCTV
jgi:hypothetical protein